jgi:hypothetical protein
MSCRYPSYDRRVFSDLFSKVVYKETEKYVPVIHVFIRFSSGDAQLSESGSNGWR